MQTVKILGIQGSRKLKTYRSKNRVLLLDSGGKTNLETFIQSEYLSASASGNNAILNAIESIDTGILTGTVNIDLVLSALEAVDSSNITADNLITAYLEESENLDTVLLTAKAILTASLSKTDNNDISSLTSSVIISSEIESIDIIDNVNITAFSGTDRNIEMSATENQDKPKITISRKQTEKSRTYIPLSRISHLKFDYSIKAVIKINENKDGCKIKILTDKSQIVSIKENIDGVRFYTKNNSISEMKASENRDQIKNDVELFFKEVEFKNNQYETSELEFFAMIA